ncbi:MAG: tetratricopeptide repeat protein [Bryobacteraceae bacterium]|nr:tetratricopeptide repeat protein [Bryobacteraceae bacterium]MDW8377509.1 tetratricopeptide repeat protein [Bryobacterales bacterium]
MNFALGWLLVPWLLAQDAAVLSQRAAAAMRGQRFDEAEKLYRQLVALEPSNPMWRMNLGLALHSSGRFSQAISELEVYLQARPQPGPVHLVLGAAYLKLRQPCQAIAPLEKAMQWNKSQTELELADAYYGCKRFEAAARAYEAASRSSRRKDIARQAAHCYWQARRYEEARRLFQTLETEYWRQAEFQYEYGDVLARLDGPEEGLPYLRRAVEANPKLTAARGELGKALLALGDAAQATPHLEAASQQDVSLLLPLSRAYRALGRLADADRTLQQYRSQVTTK